MLRRSTAALLAAALIGSVSSAPALAGPDSTSIRPPPVGSAPLRASSAARAATSDVSARALLLDSNATIDGSRITGVVQNARTSLEANQANSLSAGVTIDGSQVTGTVANAANAANATTATQAYNIYDTRTGTWQWVNNVTVAGAVNASQLEGHDLNWVRYNGLYASESGYAGSSGQTNKVWDTATQSYKWVSESVAGNGVAVGCTAVSGSIGTFTKSIRLQNGTVIGHFIDQNGGGC